MLFIHDVYDSLISTNEWIKILHIEVKVWTVTTEVPLRFPKSSTLERTFHGNELAFR